MSGLSSFTSIAVLIFTSAAFAQVPEVVHALDWTEVHVGTANPVANPNGVIEPGEAAMLSLSVSFTPAVGTLVPFGSGTAPLAGYRASGFVLEPHHAFGGVWTHFSLAPGFQIAFPHHPFSNGGLLTGVLQTWHPHPWVPDPSPLFEDVWRAVWTPPSYMQRIVGFEMTELKFIPGPSPPMSNMYVFDGANYVLAPATAILDSVQIPVVPSPGALSLAAGLALFAARRRRRC